MTGGSLATAPLAPAMAGIGAVLLLRLVPMALFALSVFLVERAWMDGPRAPSSALAAALLPTVLGAAGLALAGQRIMAAFLTLWTARSASLVLERRACGSAAIPCFRHIRAFGWEMWGWKGGFAVVWVGMWLGGAI